MVARLTCTRPCTPPHVVRTPCPRRPKGLACETWATTFFRNLKAASFGQARPRPVAPFSQTEEPSATISAHELAPPSAGIRNGGNNCYLIALMQGIMGDPITRQCIVRATGALEDPGEQVRAFFEELETCCQEFERAQNKPKETLNFIIRLRDVLDIVRATGVLEDPGEQVRAFFQELETCCQEFESAQNKPKETLDFIIRLRDALAPIVTGTNLLLGRQEDPSEILTTILSYISPTGNPLFSSITEATVLDLEKVGEEDRAKFKTRAEMFALFRSCICQPEQLLEGSQGFGVEECEGAEECKESDLGVNGNELQKNLSTCLEFFNDPENSLPAKMKGDFIRIIEHLRAKISRSCAFDELTSLIEEAKELMTDSDTNLAYDESKKELTKFTSPDPSPLYTLKIDSKAESRALESLLEANFVEHLSDISIDVAGGYRLTGKRKKCTYEKAPPHLLMALNRTLGSVFSSKNTDPVYLGETFFLDPDFTEDKTGGEYELRWFIVHLGGLANFGHYVLYRKTTRGWYRFNDEEVSFVTSDKAIRESQQCCLFFASKTDQSFSQEQIKEKIGKKIEDAQQKANHFLITQMAASFCVTSFTLISLGTHIYFIAQIVLSIAQQFFRSDSIDHLL